MQATRKIPKNRLHEELGQDPIEYALVGLGAVTAMSGLGTKISATLTSIGTTLTANV